MIRASRVRAVASFEFLAAVRRPSYLVMTFGLPLFFFLVTGLPLLLQKRALSESAEAVGVYDVIDEAGVLALGTEGYSLDSLHFRPSPNVDAARARLAGERTRGYFVIPPEYLKTGLIEEYLPPRPPLADVHSVAAERTLSRLLVDRLLKGRVPPEVRDRALDPMKLERSRLEADGGVRGSVDLGLEAFARLLPPLGLSILLLMALMTTSGYLVHAVSVEKENRVVEVLLAALDPDEILAGKLLGLGAAGLLQFFIWAIIAVVGGASAAGVLDELAIDIPWEAMAVAPIMFVLGYLFLGSLMLATGSLGTSAAESQKLTLLWALLAVVPLMMLPAIAQNPSGPVAVLCAWIPFTAPLGVVLRLTLNADGVPLTEIVGPILVLITSTWLSLRLGARLFRVGFLLTGSRPKLRDLIRQAKL